MKLIFRSLFCCFILSTTCHASNASSKKWSWPVATALGLKKTITPPQPHLPKKDSDEWEHVESSSLPCTTQNLSNNGHQQRTPSPILTDHELDGSIIHMPAVAHRSTTKIDTVQPRKLSAELQTDIMIQGALKKSSLKEVPKVTAAKDVVSAQTINPMVNTMNIDRNEDHFTEQSSHQTSIYGLLVAGCCPCLPRLTDQNSEKKKTVKFDAEKIMKDLQDQKYDDVINHLDHASIGDDVF